MIKKIKMLILLPVLLSAAVLPVHAETSTVQIPVTVEGTEKATVTIASEDKEAIKAVKGDKTITIDKAGTFTIEYDEPADFKYTLTQTAGKEKNSKGEKITYDTAEYIAHVFIEAKDDGSLDPHVIVWKESQDSKSVSVGFKNTVEKKNSGGADTSDESNIGYEAAAFVTALCFGLLLIGFRYREKHTKYDDE